MHESAVSSYSAGSVLNKRVAVYGAIKTTAAIKKLSSGKAAGPDAIDAEIHKHGINLTKSLVKLFNNIWDSRAVPQEQNLDLYMVYIDLTKVFESSQQRWFMADTTKDWLP